MTIGLIVESGPQGAEVQVLPKLMEKLGVRLKPSIVTFENKPRMIEGCGSAASSLLGGGCRRVLIVWDLYPAWREESTKPCRREDRTAIRASLKAAAIPAGRVFLVCIWEELEAWLIADGRALSAVLSRPTHPVSVQDRKWPDRVHNPKKALRRLFREKGHGDYSDRIHAIKIVNALPDLTRIKRSDSFSRFAGVLAV